jgi:hypothetical protein
MRPVSCEYLWKEGPVRVCNQETSFYSSLYFILYNSSCYILVPLLFQVSLVDEVIHASLSSISLLLLKPQTGMDPLLPPPPPLPPPLYTHPYLL